MQYETHVASENFEYQLWHKGRLKGLEPFSQFLKSRCSPPTICVLLRHESYHVIMMQVSC